MKKKLLVVSLLSVGLLGGGVLTTHSTLASHAYADEAAPKMSVADLEKAVADAKANVTKMEETVKAGEMALAGVESEAARKAEAIKTATAELTAAKAALEGVEEGTVEDYVLEGYQAAVTEAQAKLDKANAIVVADLAAVKEMIARDKLELQAAKAELEAAEVALVMAQPATQPELPTATGNEATELPTATGNEAAELPTATGNEAAELPTATGNEMTEPTEYVPEVAPVQEELPEFTGELPPMEVAMEETKEETKPEVKEEAKLPETGAVSSVLAMTLGTLATGAGAFTFKRRKLNR